MIPTDNLRWRAYDFETRYRAMKMHLSDQAAATRTAPVVLVTEDDANDVYLIRRAFEKTGFGCRLEHAASVEQAKAYLAGEGEYCDRERFPSPDLLLLDLQLVGKSGLDLLSWLGGREKLRNLRVVVLSSSNLESDILQAGQLGARDYKVKPSDFNSYIRLVKDLQLKWLERRSFSRSW